MLQIESNNLKFRTVCGLYLLITSIKIFQSRTYETFSKSRHGNLNYEELK